MHRLLAAVLLLTQGCAFALDGPAGDRPRSEMPKCDTGKGVVALDATVAVLAGVIALSLASEDEAGIALVPLGIGALYAGGAISGNNHVNRCREAMADFESYVAERDAQPAHPPRPVLAAEPERAPQPSPAVASPPPPVAVPAPAPPAAQKPALAPPVTQKPAPAPARPAPAAEAEAEADEGEWSAFWREVP